MQGDPAALLIVEYYGESEAELDAKLDELQRAIGPSGVMTRCLVGAQIRDVWAIRKVGLGLAMSARLPVQAQAFIEDAAVPVEHLPDYITRLEGVMREAGTEAVVYAHASAGCLHVRPFLDIKQADDIAAMERIAAASADLVKEYGGIVASEHGDGLARSWLAPSFYGARPLRGLSRRQRRLRPRAPVQPEPRRRSAADDGEPPLRAGLRHDPGDERPRLRAGRVRRGRRAVQRLGRLPQARRGDDVPELHGDGRGEGLDARPGERAPPRALRRAPARVADGAGDEGRDGPLHLVQGLQVRVPGVGRHGGAEVGVAGEAVGGGQDAAPREAPRRPPEAGAAPRRPARPARQPARNVEARTARRSASSASRRSARSRLSRATRFDGATTEAAGDRPRVVLYADTFNRFLEPDVARAAHAVLEAAGFAVVVPPYRCCGRTYLSKGVLGRAKELAREAIDTLAPYAEAGLPIVGLEPSCILTLRDEFLALWPDDARAKAVAAQAQTFEEFVAAHAETFAALPWQSAGRVLLHGHCHQKALSGIAPSVACLKTAGFEVEPVDSGCCGMAGAFGYEAEHVAVSKAMAERVLAPAVRAASPETHVAAAGTSCRAQIADTADREARHPAELMAAALGLK